MRKPFAEWTTADRIRYANTGADNMLGALDDLADKCKEAQELIDEIEDLAKACDIGYVPFSTIPGGYYEGVNSNIEQIRKEAKRLMAVRS